MNLLKVKDVDLVPGKIVENGEEDCIYIFVHKMNGKVYKRKKWQAGVVFWHPKTKEYCFQGMEEFCFTVDFMLIMSEFLYKLKIGSIKLDKEEGLVLVK